MFVPQYPYPVLGGLEKQAHELAKALLKKGLNVRVISGCIAQGNVNDEVVEGIRVTRLPWSRSRRLRFLRSPWDIARALWAKRRDFEVLHLHQYSPASLYVIVLAKLLGKPVLTKLMNVGDYGLPGVRRWVFGWLRLRILLSSDAIVAMSEESCRELQAFNFPASRVLRVPNGIDLANILARSPPSEVAKSVVCRVVCVGRLSEEKQLGTLLAAWDVVSQSCKHLATLHLWGDGPLAPELKIQAKQLGIEEMVHFHGHVTGVPARLQEMDVFVLPSRVEGNSNAVLEAMAVGLPIVATAVGGTPMQVGPEGAPFLFAPGDSASLAVILKQFIENPVLRAATGTAMRRRTEQHFEINRIAGIYLQAYRCLAEGRADEIWHLAHPVLSPD